MNVFVDESGDLGFSKKSTKYFIVAYLFIKKCKKFQESFKWFHKKMKRKYNYQLDELKFSQSRDEVRKQGLNLICGTSSCNFGVVIVNKSRINKKSSFYNDPEGIYRYIIVSTVMNAIVPRLSKREIFKLVLDKRIPQSHRGYFENYAISKGYQLIILLMKTDFQSTN